MYAQQRANLASVVPEQVWADNVSYSDGYNLSSIYNFCTDRQGKVWAAGQSGVANFSGALMQYYFPGDPVNKKGLNDGPFYAVVMDAQQRIWVSGNSGLYWFDEVRDSFCLVSNPEGGAWQPGRRLIVADKSGQFLWLADQSGL